MKSKFSWNYDSNLEFPRKQVSQIGQKSPIRPCSQQWKKTLTAKPDFTSLTPHFYLPPFLSPFNSKFNLFTWEKKKRRKNTFDWLKKTWDLENLCKYFFVLQCCQRLWQEWLGWIWLGLDSSNKSNPDKDIWIKSDYQMGPPFFSFSQMMNHVSLANHISNLRFSQTPRPLSYYCKFLIFFVLILVSNL